MTPVPFSAPTSFPDKPSSPKQNWSYLVSSQAPSGPPTPGISRSFGKLPIVAKIGEMQEARPGCPEAPHTREATRPWACGRAPFPRAVATNTLSGSGSAPLRDPAGAQVEALHSVRGLAQAPQNLRAVSGLPAGSSGRSPRGPRACGAAWPLGRRVKQRRNRTLRWPTEQASATTTLTGPLAREEGRGGLAGGRGRRAPASKAPVSSPARPPAVATAASRTSTAPHSERKNK